MKLKKIRLHELEQFLESEAFRSIDPKPISPFRVKSYMNNPHGEPDDFVLYYLHVGDTLIGYRTLFAAKLTNQSDRFAWLSGNWVHPDYRRQGFSEKLLNEIMIDWDHRLMFTNYAPASLQLYLKSKQFQPIYNAEGERFYLFARTKSLLKDRLKGIGGVLTAADFFIRLIASLSCFFHKPWQNSDYEIRLQEFPDEMCLKMTEEEQPNYLFKRGEKELKWIFDYSWISTKDSSFSGNYAFSSYAKSFHYQTASFYSGNKLVGFLVYSFRDGHLKTVHSHLPIEALPVAARFLINQAAKNKIEFLTVLNPGLVQEIKKTSNPFLWSKKFEHVIYASFNVATEELKIQDGDGDFIFT